MHLRTRSNQTSDAVANVVWLTRSLQLLSHRSTLIALVSTLGFVKKSTKNASWGKVQFESQITCRDFLVDVAALPIPSYGSSEVGRTLGLQSTDNIISLAEESVPVIQDLFLLV
jgi:hypothetical protein